MVELAHKTNKCCDEYFSFGIETVIKAIGLHHCDISVHHPQRPHEPLQSNPANSVVPFNSPPIIQFTATALALQLLGINKSGAKISYRAINQIEKRANMSHQIAIMRQ